MNIQKASSRRRGPSFGLCWSESSPVGSNDDVKRPSDGAQRCMVAPQQWLYSDRRCAEQVGVQAHVMLDGCNGTVQFWVTREFRGWKQKIELPYVWLPFWQLCCLRKGVSRTLLLPSSNGCEGEYNRNVCRDLIPEAARQGDVWKIL